MFVKRTVLVLLFDCTVIFYVYHCWLWFQEINLPVIHCCTVHTIDQEIVCVLMCTGVFLARLDKLRVVVIRVVWLRIA